MTCACFGSQWHNHGTRNICIFFFGELMLFHDLDVVLHQPDLHLAVVKLDIKAEVVISRLPADKDSGGLLQVALVIVQDLREDDRPGRWRKPSTELHGEG